MTQRALFIAALGSRETTINHPLVCDDSHHLSIALRALGATVQWQHDRVTVTPALWRAPAEPLSLGNAGTAVRFIACTSLLMDAPITLDGDAYMRQRPIGPLVEALQQLGVHSHYHQRPGCPPVTLERQDHTPSSAKLDASLSSQYLSGLLMVAPRLSNGLTLRVEGRAVSRPYLTMTLAMMRAAGAQAHVVDRHYVVAPGGYPGIGPRFPTPVEPDWSAAAFLLVAKRISNRDVTIAGLNDPRTSLQGDAIIAEWLARYDAPGPYRFDLTDHPDLIAPLAAAALFADGPTQLDNVAHARVKECDRVAVLAEQLGRLGAHIETTANSMRITPLSGCLDGPITLDPAHDHRMAMTFGVVSLRHPSIAVAHPACVSKSFTDFWEQLAKLRG